MKISQLKGGAALSFASIFLKNIIGLLITPFIIRSLGSSEYGLYTMMGALVGYLSVLDFGLNNTVIRFVAKYKAQNDKLGEENFLAHSFIMYGCISLLVIVIGAFVYVNLDGLYGETLSPVQMGKAKIMMAILIFNLALSLPGGAFVGICYGYEQFILPKVVIIIRYIVRSALVIALLMYGGDSVSLVILDTVLNLLIIGVNAWIAFRILKVRIKMHHYQKKLFFQILAFSIWLFVFALVHQLRWQFGQLILGLFYSTTIIAIYAVGITLGNYYGSFSNAIASVFLPRAIQMTVQGSSRKDLTDMFIKVSRIILIVLLFVLGGFITVGRDFVFYWVGDEYNAAYTYAFLIMIGLTPILSQGFANNVLEAKNLLAYRGRVMLIVTIIGTICSFFTAKYFGTLAMILTTILFMLSERVIMTPFYHKHADLNMWRYYREISPLFMSAAFVIIVFHFLSSSLPQRNLWVFFATGTVYSLCYAVVFYKFIITTYEKSLLLSIIKKVPGLSKLKIK